MLERGELALEFGDGLLVVKYGDNELPINPSSRHRFFDEPSDR